MNQVVIEVSEIEINGVTKSINSINEAKEAISELQDIMDNSTFGSEEFIEFSSHYILVLIY